MGILDPLRPKWKNSDPDVRRKAAEELDDPATLVEIAAKDSEWFVRHEALAKLRLLEPEQRWYFELVKTSIDEEIRRKTVKHHCVGGLVEPVLFCLEYPYPNIVIGQLLFVSKPGLHIVPIHQRHFCFFLKETRPRRFLKKAIHQ